MHSKYEIVEFYPETSEDYKKFLGTLHIYLVEKQIDIRGIRVYNSKKGLFFSLPTGKSFDPEEKRIVVYPLISFSDQKIMQELKEFVFQEGKNYVLKKLTEIDSKQKKSNGDTFDHFDKDISTKSLKSGKKVANKKES